jgi:hypothetical protein
MVELGLNSVITQKATTGTIYFTLFLKEWTIRELVKINFPFLCTSKSTNYP